MSFDGLVTRAITHELKQTIETGRISKVYQPHKTDLVFTIRAQGKNHKLFLSASPSFARLHLTNHSYDNPSSPPMFCMLLRKHLEGSFIESITQHDMERIVEITVRTRDEIGDETTKKIIIEIMGRHSNILLLDEKSGKIIDCIKHIPPSQNRHRTLLPGQHYVRPPEQHKLSPFGWSKEEVAGKLRWNEGKLPQQIVQTFSGVSPLLAAEIVHSAGLSTKENIASAFTGLMGKLNMHQYEPQMTSAQGKEYFYLAPLTHIGGEAKTFGSVSELLDRFYSGKADRDRIRQQAHDLERFLHNEFEKLTAKIKKLEKELINTEKAEQLKRKGELITAYMYQAKKGDTFLEAEDYFDENMPLVKIALEPMKTPAENAQHYFKKYNKMKKSISAITDQIAIAKEEVAYFDRLLTFMESASINDVEEIREELAEGGYVRQRGSSKKKVKEKPAIEEYVSSDGTLIFVGKNNKQNDYLTHKLARQNETWLHTKDIPGSHVLIRSEDPSDTAVLEAAHLAAYFSKARHSGSVPVDYTQVRNVKKPSGAKPGFVIYDSQQTLYVTPEEDIILRLKKK
ncbi:NFACT family protein [Fictibacillus iocasae]|uniref:Rqc2 homolog RqcH n=1 Tax=Fictibacillus iocasae TaxID=2715437 RepID=A0ABW2NNU1_9BACL